MNRVIATSRLVALPLVGLVLCGCTYLGYPLMLLSGPPTISARYEPTDRKTVVLVDDTKELLSSAVLGDQIAERIVQNLKEAGIITQFVSVNDLRSLRSQTRDFDQWPIDRVGRHFDAEQVLFIQIEAFEMGVEKDFAQPTASVRVKMIEVDAKKAEAKRLFPKKDKLGYPLSSNLLFQRSRLNTESAGNEATAARKLAMRLAGAIAFLFYKHEAPDYGRRK